jgi:iron complex transport system ATP-binding protein
VNNENIDCPVCLWQSLTYRTAVQPNIGKSNSLAAIDLHGVGVLRSERWILKNIVWRVERGTCAAILGPNGSGKSTLARILAGHLWPSEGQCSVLGDTFGEVDLTELRRGIRLLQPAGPYDVDAALTARQVVLTGFFGTLGLYDSIAAHMEREADRVLSQVGLMPIANNPYYTLSSGERIRALIARALVLEPRLLLLDEPTAGLDLLAREQVLATIQSLFEDESDPPTVVLITHHVEELPPATSQVLVLNQGKGVAAGAPSQVLKSEILSEVYNCPVQVRAAAGRYYVEVHPQAWKGLVHPT